MKVTIGSLFSAEGWLELEAHESDLRGSRGIAIAGALMLFMGILNFKNTVLPAALLQSCKCAVCIYVQAHLHRPSCQSESLLSSTDLGLANMLKEACACFASSFA